MSGSIPSLNLKDEDVTKFLASSTHIGATNLDFQMEQYVFKRRSDGESSQKSKKQVVDCRRSTAAQFFVEESIQETVTSEMVVQLINDAMNPKEENGTLKNLQIVKELILIKDPKLLDIFLDEVVNFQLDKNADVRRFIVQFIEDACKVNPQTLPKVVGNLIMMLQDCSVNVQKKVIQTTIQLYTVAMRWLCNAKKVTDIMVATWESITKLKNNILSLIDSDNEGIRAMTVKFMECVVVAQTLKDQYSESKESEISLDQIPLILKVFRPRKMEEEAKEIFQRIISFHSASHVSSCNLMACMQVLTTIAKKRFQFFAKVLQAFESLHANLPPTLSQSQVSSVRKNLKLQLLTLCKHPASVEFQSQISIMLSDLGATPVQINKCFPASDGGKKRSSSKTEKNWNKQSGTSASEPSTSKPGTSSEQTQSAKPKTSAIDATAEDITPKLNNTNVADLVLVSMLSLPDVMPPLFQNTYTPIAAAGTEPQVRHLARLLATQLTLAGFGKEAVKDESATYDQMSDDEDEFPTKQIKTIVGRTTETKPKKPGVVLLPSGSVQPKTNLSKRIDFQSKPFTEIDMNKFCQSAYERILRSEKAAVKKGAGPMRTKILCTLASQFGGEFSADLKQHVLENPRGRLDLGFSWLYQEYVNYKGFEGSAETISEKYEDTLNDLLNGLLESEEQNHALFSRFFIDVPYIGGDATRETLKRICTIGNLTEHALEIAKSLCVRRPPNKLLFLGVISDLTLHDNNDIRSHAVDAVVEIYETGQMKSFIENFAIRSLKYLLDPIPQPSQLPFFKELPDVWNDDLIKICLHLYFALLPINHKLIRDLGTVYVETTADVKRTILRALEIPVKKMSMASPELLHFVENCPQGAETFVTRIIHILTDKAAPSAELVARVRDLYQKRFPDIRFLIPIINGLTKREIIAALPELIKLNPTVVKEAFHRLVGSNLVSPLSPAELLVALHNIDQSQCNLKTIIKATSLCFEEKQVYTQVVLAMVMQQLMEQNPLPILLMRTVIQSLANHPHLLGFVTNILQRLILKQVWKQPKIWEGFIKCCQRTKPQSFQVLLQLPPTQLSEVLNSYSDLREPLVQHIDAFTEHQKAHIPKTILDVLDKMRPNDPLSSDMHVDVSELDLNSEPLPPGEE